MTKPTIVLATTLLFSTACVTDHVSEPTCEPLEDVACACPDGSTGTQRCDSSGEHFDACDCDLPAGPDDTETLPPDPASPNESFIVGGQLSRSFAAAGALVSPSGQTFCTATLISETKVLTAAHCVVSAAAFDVRFVLGVDPARGIERAVTHIAVHDSYRFSGPEPLQFDVAVLTLASPVTEVEPAVLHLGNANNLLRSPLTLVGYGKQNGSAAAVTGLRARALVEVARVDPQFLVYSFMGMGSCNGDSGGPAFTKIEGAWRQVGITSKGAPSCTGLGFYQRLDVAAPWLASLGISDGTRDVECEPDGQCDGQCDEDPDCADLVCPAGSCAAPDGRCLADGSCDTACGDADPDCQSATDYCEKYDFYDNGHCDAGCPKRDPECDIQMAACIPAFYQVDIYGTCYYYDPSWKFCGAAPAYCTYWGCTCG